MSTEDVSHLLDGEGQQQEPTPQPEATPQIEPETVTFKVRGEERQIPADRIDALAEAMGTSRDATLMWLQTGKDAGSHYQELRQRERELAQREAEWQAHLAREQERQQRQGYSAPQPQPQQPSTGLPDDPLELLKWQAARMQQLESMVQNTFKRFEDVQNTWQQREHQEAARRETAAIESAYQRLVESKKSAGLPVPDYETIERELLETGMANNRALPWDKAMERAYRNVYFDDYGKIAERRAMEKLRDPKATVTIAGGGSQAPKPAPVQNSENILGGMTVSQARELFPEAR